MNVPEFEHVVLLVWLLWGVSIAMAFIEGVTP